MILAIDPGSHESAWVQYGGREAGMIRGGIIENNVLLRNLPQLVHGGWGTASLAIEMIASYGMPVGAEVFETCVWIGRMIERCQSLVVVPETRLIYRRDVKLHLCGSARAKDANIRQVLVDRFGGNKLCKGTKGSPGPLYGFHDDMWAALAVAVTAQETAA